MTEPTNFDAGRGFFRGNRRDTQLSCPCCSAHWQRFVAAAGLVQPKMRPDVGGSRRLDVAMGVLRLLLLMAVV